MAITAKATVADSNPIESGVHIGICTRIIDLGTQHNELFGVKQHKVMLTWEVPDDTIEIDGEAKPKMISKEYTLSLSDKANLKKDLEAWRGKAFTDFELAGFDLVAVLGKACQLQILINDKGYSYIASIMALPKGVNVPEAATPTIYFDLEDANSLSLIDDLPAWIGEKIKASPEYIRLAGGSSAQTYYADIEDDGDLPF